MNDGMSVYVTVNHSVSRKCRQIDMHIGKTMPDHLGLKLRELFRNRDTADLLFRSTFANILQDTHESL